MLFTSRLRDGIEKKGHHKRPSIRDALVGDPARVASALLKERVEGDRGESDTVLAARRRALMRRHTVDDEPGTSSTTKKGSTKKKKSLTTSFSSGSVRGPRSAERRPSTEKKRAAAEERKSSFSASPAHRRLSKGRALPSTTSIPEEPLSLAHKMVESGGPPAMPPPPLPDDAWGEAPPLPPSASSHDNGWDTHANYQNITETAAPPTSYQPQASVQSVQSSQQEGDDFDWSDDEHEGRRGSSVQRSRDLSTDDETSRAHARSRHESTDDHDSREEPMTPSSPSQVDLERFPSQDGSGRSGDPASNALAVPGRSGGGDGVERKGTVKKSFNRFSNFVKSGTEAYILQTVKLKSEPSERHEILLTSFGAEWKPLDGRSDYAVRVDKPKKESKMHGLKSFIAYQLTPASTGIQVSRRYKHFDWLLARFSEKYAVLPVPPLPEKQVSGRYEDEFIEHRMQLLQLWVDKITRHPVFATSEVWQHFITCTDDKKWKEGKRKAEKDEYTGGNFFLSITVPSRPIDIPEVEAKVESFSRVTKALEEGVKGMSSVAADGAKKMAGPYKREWQKFGQAFHQLGAAFELDDTSKSDPSDQALSRTAENYFKIAQLFAEQPKKDLEPLQDHLFAYKGILTCIPETINTHRSAIARLKDHEKMKAEGKISQAELDGIQSRVDTIGYTMQAEVTNFHKERRHDFNHMMSVYLKEQITFYQEVVTRLQDSLGEFEK